MSDIVGMSNFKIFFDTQNYWKLKGYNTPDMYDELSGFICSNIHVKDGYGAPVSSAMLGEGDSQFFETAERIKKSRFTGWIILENSFDQIPLCLESHNTIELITKDLATSKQVFG